MIRRFAQSSRSSCKVLQRSISHQRPFNSRVHFLQGENDFLTAISSKEHCVIRIKNKWCSTCQNLTAQAPPEIGAFSVYNCHSESRALEDIMQEYLLDEEMSRATLIFKDGELVKKVTGNCMRKIDEEVVLALSSLTPASSTETTAN